MTGNNIKKDQDELEILFENEKEWINLEEPRIIEKLLNLSLNDNLQKAFSDMVHIIQASIYHSPAKEKDIIPTFQKL